MASVNRVTLVGYLGRDPEIRTFPDGGMVCNVNLATTDRWRDKTTGEDREATEWHRLVFKDKLAEIANNHLRKGSQIYAEGTIRTRKYDKDGVDHYVVEIHCNTMQMLGSRPNDNRQSGSNQPPTGGDQNGQGYDD